MQRVFAAVGAVFFKRQLLFVEFFVLLYSVVNFFTDRAGKFDVLFGNSGHN